MSSRGEPVARGARWARSPSRVLPQPRPRLRRERWRQNAQLEAIGLLPMVDPQRPGHCTREMARQMIAPASLNHEADHDHAQRHRRETLLCFDILLWKKATRDHRNGGICAAIAAGYLTRELEAEIVRLFRLDLTQKEINRLVPLGIHSIERISKRLRAAEWKKAQGRRIPAEVKEKIVEGIRTMQRPGWREITNRSLARQFLVSEEFVVDLRRALGDREDRRFRKKLSTTQVRQAVAMLRRHTWRTVAQAFGCALHTLQKVCPLKSGIGEP